MNLYESVKEWIQWTREMLPDMGDYPKMNVDWDTPWDDIGFDYFEDYSSDKNEQLVNLFANELTSNPEDVAARFTALKVFYDLSHYSSMFREEEVVYKRDAFLADLGLLVRLLAADRCVEMGSIRWEILNAYAVRDWDRATDLYRQVEFLKLIDLSELHILRGQFNFLVVFLPKVFGSENDMGLESLSWEPKIYDFEDVNGLCLFGLSLCGIRDYAPLTTGDSDRVRDAINDLEKALTRVNILQPIYHCILAMCYFSIGDYLKAARNYEKVLREAQFPSPTMLKPRLYNSIARSYKLAEQTHKAIATYQELLSEFPDEKGVNLRLAELYANEKIDTMEVSEAIKKEFEKNPSIDSDWRLSTILMLAETHGPDVHEARVKDFFKSNPSIMHFIDSLLSEYWQSFVVLGEQTRQMWVYGACQMHFRCREPDFSHTLLREAARSFATVVELEIKSRVFKRFREQFSQRNDSQMLLAQKPVDDEFKRFWGYLKGNDRITLGQMFFVLNRTRNSGERIIKTFDEWLQSNCPLLMDKLSLLKKILDVRNPATHPDPTPSEEEMKNTSTWCREILETILPSANGRVR